MASKISIILGGDFMSTIKTKGSNVKTKGLKGDVSKTMFLSFNGEISPIPVCLYQRIEGQIMEYREALEKATDESELAPITINKAQVHYVTARVREALQVVRQRAAKKAAATKGKDRKEIMAQDVKILAQDPESFFRCLPADHPAIVKLEGRKYFITEPKQFHDLIKEATEAGVDVTKEAGLVKWICDAKNVESLVISDYVASVLYMSKQPYGIRITKPYGTVIRLKNDIQVTRSTTALEAYQSIIDEAVARVIDEDQGKFVKEQYPIGQLHITDLDEKLVDGKCVYSAIQALSVETSSSLMSEVAAKDGYKIVSLDLNINVQRGKMSDEEYAMALERRNRLVTNVIYNGFLLPKAEGSSETELYLPLLQTASQARVGKVYMINIGTHEEIEEFRHKLTFDAFRKVCTEQEETILATMEARFALSGTSSVKIGIVPKEKYNWEDVKNKTLEDCVKTVSYKVYRCEYIRNEKGEVIDYELVQDVVTENNATDGTGLASPTWFATANYELGLISYGDCMYFKEKFTSIDDLKHTKDTRLKSIFKRMTKVVQIRWGCCKGLLVMADLDKYEKSKGLDIYLTEGMVKAVTEKDAELRIANVNNKKWGKQRLSQQFMTSINLNVDEVKEMLDEQLNYLQEKVLVDINEARRFVGSIASCEDLVDLEENGDLTENGSDSIIMATKLAVALSRNKDVLYEKWIQKKLYELMQTEITRLKYGKLAVNGIYAYCIPDPRSILDPDNALKAGEYYLNGRTGLMALLRSPQIHNTEAHVCNFVDDDYLWYLNDVLVFNPWDNTAQASQGADYDGDQFLVTDDPRVIAAILRHGDKDTFILQEIPGATKIKERYSIKARLDLYIRRSSKDNVGILSNYALIWSDMRNHLLAHAEEQTDPIQKQHFIDSANAVYKNVAILACLIGGEIDFAKTGVRGVLLEKLIPVNMPDFFLHYKGEVKHNYDYSNPQALAKQIMKVQQKKGIYYASKSALGFCFRYVSKFQKELFAKIEQPKATQSLFATVCEGVTDQALASVMTDVLDLLKTYGQAMSDLHRGVANGSIAPELEKDLRNQIFERYQDLFDNLSDDKRAVAAACYIATNRDNAKNSKSAPWIFCFDGLMSLISNNQADILVRLPKFAAADSKVEIYKGVMFIDDVAYKECRAKDGIYQPITIMNDLYIDAKVAGNIDYSSSKTQTQREAIKDVQVSIVGLKQHTDRKGRPFDAKRVVNALMQGHEIHFVFANGKYNAVIYGQVVGTMKTDIDNNSVLAKRLSGKRVKVTGIRGQKRPLCVEDAYGKNGGVLSSLTLLVEEVGEAQFTVEEKSITTTNPNYDNYNEGVDFAVSSSILESMNSSYDPSLMGDDSTVAQLCDQVIEASISDDYVPIQDVEFDVTEMYSTVFTGEECMYDFATTSFEDVHVADDDAEYDYNPTVEIVEFN